MFKKEEGPKQRALWNSTDPVLKEESKNFTGFKRINADFCTADV